MSNLMQQIALLNSSLEFSYPVHKDYTLHKGQWKRVRDTIAGQEVIKAMQTTYLPRLSAQTNDDYISYLNRALFVNTSARVLNTNVGTMVRRSPELKYSSDMAPYFEEDTSSFVSFNELFRFLTRENAGMGRVGCLIDIDPKRNILIPIRFKTEQILNWLEDEYGNVTSILLYQFESKIDPKTFDETTALYYYILYINSDGEYSVLKTNDKKEEISNRVISLRGKTIDYIPFVCINAFGVSLEPVKPPMIDVVEINLSHYRTSADLETGRHFVGLPQPIVSGATSDKKLRVGSSEAWVLPNKDAKAYYLEFLGQGLDGLAKALKEKEGQMSQFSAQLVDTSTRGSEAEGTVRMRFSSDAANLSDIALSVETGLRTVYKIIAEWSGYEVPVIELNKDFISDRLSYNELRELTKTWLEGGMTDEEYRYNLKRGELYPPKKNGYEDRTKLEKPSENQ